MMRGFQWKRVKGEENRGTVGLAHAHPEPDGGTKRRGVNKRAGAGGGKSHPLCRERESMLTDKKLNPDF